MAAYQDDTLKVLQIELRVTLKKKYEDYGEKVLQNLEEQFKNYQDKKGVTLQTGNHDNIVRIHLLLDVDKMKKKDLEEFNIVNLKNFLVC